MDPVRLSEDPVDAMGDDERHPDECTEPPDKPEGMGLRDAKQKVKEIKEAEVGMLRVSTKSAGGMDDNDKMCQLGKLTRPLEHAKSPDGAHEPAHQLVGSQFNQDGELTRWQRQEHVTHKHADA